MYVIQKTPDGVVYAKYETSTEPAGSVAELIEKALFDARVIPCTYQKTETGWAVTPAQAPEIAGVECEPTPEPPPTAEEQLRADVDYIAAMTGVEL